jgi:phosphatidylserine/phosphatidylglycerophosphate/cardiolipin synthase-like enzyme
MQSSRLPAVSVAINPVDNPTVRPEFVEGSCSDKRMLRQAQHERKSEIVGYRPAINNDNRRDGAGRVVASYGPQAHQVLQSLHRRIKSAHHRVWIVTPYFMPSWKLRQRLIGAARCGVDTRILVPGVHTDHPAFRQASRRYYARLLLHGVRIFEYQPRFIHAKIALCDDWASIGSTNFDRWNLRWNLDANQEVADINFATQLVTMLDSDFAQSIELRQQDWLHRPWHQRCMEWVTGWLERWSGRLR